MKEKLDFRPLTVRLSSEEGEALERLAVEMERDVAWVHRRLIREALTARGTLPSPSPAPVVRPRLQESAPRGRGAR